MLYVYKFTNNINGKIYVGSTKNPEWRKYCHKRESICNRRTSRFYNAAIKYGWESFQFDILEETCPFFREERENHWILYYKTLDKNYGYNMRLADNSSVTEDTIEKMRKALTGRKLSPEHISKMSERLKGNKHTLGHKFSDERNKKLSERMSGDKNPFFGKNHKNESMEKQKASAKRNGKHYMTGRKMSEETKRKISEATTGKKKNRKNKV